MSWKVTKGLIALTPEIYRDQMVIGLPPGTSAVFFIVKSLGKIGCLGGISDVSATPSGIKLE
jgi:hypothetical protein